MPTTDPGSVTYSSTASGSAATSRRGWPPCRAVSMFTSSGRQMPASEQRGHFLTLRGQPGRGRPRLTHDLHRAGHQIRCHLYRHPLPGLGVEDLAAIDRVPVLTEQQHLKRVL